MRDNDLFKDAAVIDPEITEIPDSGQKGIPFAFSHSFGLAPDIFLPAYRVFFQQFIHKLPPECCIPFHLFDRFLHFAYKRVILIYVRFFQQFKNRPDRFRCSLFCSWGEEQDLPAIFAEYDKILAENAENPQDE